MRLTEHLHMLIQIFPFTHPRTYYESRAFKDAFRRIWSYFASVSFTSVEALAARLGAPSAWAAAKDSHLLPVALAQQKLLGSTAAEESFTAQMKARGGEVCAEWKKRKRENSTPSPRSSTATGPCPRLSGLAKHCRTTTAASRSA